jgi:hypothetical protein
MHLVPTTTTTTTPQTTTTTTTTTTAFPEPRTVHLFRSYKLTPSTILGIFLSSRLRVKGRRFRSWGLNTEETVEMSNVHVSFTISSSLVTLGITRINNEKFCVLPTERIHVLFGSQDTYTLLPSPVLTYCFNNTDGVFTARYALTF